ncbi:hypothetical protein QQ045_031901 [Rhodiola kirilowii]
MVVSSESVFESSLSETCKPINNFQAGIPVVDFSRPMQEALLIKACEEFGFFKVINHGVSVELIAKLEEEAVRFYNLSQSEKEKAGYPYGNKRIGPNGDVGWIEYLLFSANQQYVSGRSGSGACLPDSFMKLVEVYVKEVQMLACNVLELMAEGMQLESKDELSKMLKNEKSDSFFRINHYPNHLKARCGQNMIGFGEHTDPQIISVLRSNNTSGLQISGRADGNWISVLSDSNSFFINVGDTLQVLTNGRFKSVKHRVLADSRDSRLSMIYFAGPALSENIAPICSLMDEGEESLYKEFTWYEYKMSAFKSKLADNRLRNFEKITTATLQSDINLLLLEN